MIRGKTETGSLFIGLVRGELFARLLAGERVCLPGSVEGGPHVCLYLRDTNEELIEATTEYFFDGLMPGAPVSHDPEEPK